MSYLWGQGVKGQKVLIIIRNHQALYVPNMGNLRSLHTGCVVFLCIKNIFGLTYFLMQLFSLNEFVALDQAGFFDSFRSK